MTNDDLTNDNEYGSADAPYRIAMNNTNNNSSGSSSNDNASTNPIGLGNSGMHVALTSEGGNLSTTQPQENESEIGETAGSQEGAGAHFHGDEDGDEPRSAFSDSSDGEETDADEDADRPDEGPSATNGRLASTSSAAKLGAQEPLSESEQWRMYREGMTAHKSQFNPVPAVTGIADSGSDDVEFYKPNGQPLYRRSTVSRIGQKPGPSRLSRARGVNSPSPDTSPISSDGNLLTSDQADQPSSGEAGLPRSNVNDLPASEGVIPSAAEGAIAQPGANANADKGETVRAPSSNADWAGLFGTLDDWSEVEPDEESSKRFERAHSADAMGNFSTPEDETPVADGTVGTDPQGSRGEGEAQDGAVGGNAEDATDDEVPISGRLTDSSDQRNTGTPHQETQNGNLFLPLKSGIAIDRSSTRQEEESKEAATTDGDARLPPQDAGSLESVAESDAPASPTPSNPESVDSLTGMTQEEGLAAAFEYQERSTRRDTSGEAAEFLRMQRTMLKYAEEGHPNESVRETVRELKVDPRDTMELLKAKVHRYRDQRDRADWEADQAFRHATEANQRFNQANDRLVLVMRDNDGCGEEVDRLNRRIAERDAEILMWQKYNENNAELAEKWRCREEISTSDKGTSTDGVPSPPGAVANTDTDAPTETTTWSAQRDSPNYVSEATQTESEDRGATARQAFLTTQPVSVQGPLLPSQTVRWPAEYRERLAEHLAQWINKDHRRHAARKGPEVAPLKPSRVLEIFGDGRISFSQLVCELEHMGFFFRPDHLAQNLEENANRFDILNVEILFAARRLDGSLHSVTRALEEIHTLQNELVLARRQDAGSRKLNSQYSPMEAQLEECMEAHDEREAVIERLRLQRTTLQEKLEEAQEALQLSQAQIASAHEALEESQKEAKAAQEALKASQLELEASQAALEISQTVLNASEQACKAAQEDLKASQEAVRELNKSLLRTPEQDSEKEELKHKLSDCHAHGTELEGRITDLDAKLAAGEVERKGLEDRCQQHLTERNDMENEAQVQHEANKELQAGLDAANASLSARALCNPQTLAGPVSPLSLQPQEIPIPPTPHINIVKSPPLATTSNAAADVSTLAFAPLSPRNQAHSRGIPAMPMSPRINPSRPLAWQERERKIRESATYQQARVKLAEQRDAERSAERERDAKFEAHILATMGWASMPYVPAAERWKGIVV